MTTTDDLNRLVSNEKLKIEANLLNGAAISMFAIGTVTPVVAMLYHLSSAPAESDWVSYALPLVSFFSALFVHTQAVNLLDGLQ